MTRATVYIVKCCDGSFYTGITHRDVEERVSGHNSGTYPGYTFLRRPVELVYSCDFDRSDEAIAWERQIKGWSRAKKQALINGDFDALPKLASRAKPR